MTLVPTAPAPFPSDEDPRPSSSPAEETRFPDPLADVPDEAREFLWPGLLKAVDQVLGFCEQTPPGTRHILPPRVLTHCGPRFNDAKLRQVEMKPIRRLWRIEFWLAADALEAWILDKDNGAEYAYLLTARCNRIGQIYRELARRGGIPFALLTLCFELRMLLNRGSLVIEPLLFEEIGRPSRSG